MIGLLAGFVLGLLTAAAAGIVHLWRLGAELVGPNPRAARLKAERAAAIREATASQPDPRFTTPEGSE